MNKKNITMILIGIMLLVLQFNIRIAGAYVDITCDLVGAILIAVGGFPLTKRNVLFKKMRIIMITGIILSALGIMLGIYGGIADNTYTLQIISGFATFTLIYLTYYFTEGLILEAKFQEKSAVTRSFRVTWFILGALIFVSFITVTSGIYYAVIAAQAATAIFALYYCSSVLTACSQLYMEGLPTKHMNV